MVIGLTGPKLAGKGTVADYLVKEHSAVVYHMSGILTDVCKRLHLPNSRANLVAVVTGLRSELGEDILAQVLKGDIEEAGDAVAVIDGIRMPMEMDVFSTLPGFRLLYIDAPVRTRYERALTRGEKEGESDMSFEEFEAEEGAVTETGIASLKDKATAVIENAESLDDLYSAVAQAVKTLQA